MASYIFARMFQVSLHQVRINQKKKKKKEIDSVRNEIFECIVKKL